MNEKKMPKQPQTNPTEQGGKKDQTKTGGQNGGQGGQSQKKMGDR